MESKQDPSLMATNETPAFESRRVRTHPLTVTIWSTPAFPESASAIDTSGMSYSVQAIVTVRNPSLLIVYLIKQEHSHGQARHQSRRRNAGEGAKRRQQS